MTSGPAQHGAGAPPRAQRWPCWMPDTIWAPLATAGMLLAIGAMGLGAHQPWLFPSLAPTAFTEAEYPGHRISKPYHVVAGHLIGIGAGILALKLLGAQDASAVTLTHQLTAVRVWAAALAVAMTIVVMLLARASHPPASSTTLLVALGSFRPTVHDALTIAIGVLFVAGLGAVLRRLRLGKAPGEVNEAG